MQIARRTAVEGIDRAQAPVRMMLAQELRISSPEMKLVQSGAVFAAFLHHHSDGDEEIDDFPHAVFSPSLGVSRSLPESPAAGSSGEYRSPCNTKRCSTPLAPRRSGFSRTSGGSSTPRADRGSASSERRNDREARDCPARENCRSSRKKCPSSSVCSKCGFN